MALNTFSHAVLSASLVSYPELALGSGIHSEGSTNTVVSLTAGSLDYTSVGGVAPGTNPIPAPGIGTVTSSISGVIGFDKLGAIATHPVSQLLYNPPARTTGVAAGVQPYHTGTDTSKGFGNLNTSAAGKEQPHTYTLVSPEATETVSRHRPHLKFAGDTLVRSSLSGITVALRTSPAEAGKSRHQINDHPHTGVEVQYYLGDPLASTDGNGTTVSAGLSSDHLAFVGPEHARKRLLGF
jgi:hypothetical protein